MSEIKDKLEDAGETIKRGLKKSKNRMDEKADEVQDKKNRLNKLLSYNVKTQDFFFLEYFSPITWKYVAITILSTISSLIFNFIKLKDDFI